MVFHHQILNSICHSYWWIHVFELWFSTHLFFWLIHLNEIVFLCTYWHSWVFSHVIRYFSDLWQRQFKRSWNITFICQWQWNSITNIFNRLHVLHVWLAATKCTLCVDFNKHLLNCSIDLHLFLFECRCPVHVSKLFWQHVSQITNGHI